MQYTKDIILKNVQKYGGTGFAGLNIRNNQAMIIRLKENKQRIESLIKPGFPNTIRFDRAQKIIDNTDVPSYEAGWATCLKTQKTDIDMFIPTANVKLVASTMRHGKKMYDDIKNTQMLLSALQCRSNIQAFITAIRPDKSGIVTSISDAQSMAKDMINRIKSASYTPKMIVRGLNISTGDSVASEILFVRSRGNIEGIDVNATMNQIARNEMLNGLLTNEMKGRGVAVEIIPAVHLNMSAISTSALIDKKLMKKSQGGEYGIADWHFRTFSDGGVDTFSPCHLTIGVSPTNSSYHFGKGLDAIGMADEKWTIDSIPTKNWNGDKLLEIARHEESMLPSNTNSPGFQ